MSKRASQKGRPLDLIREALRKNRDLSQKEAKDLVLRSGQKFYPFAYGHARVLEGIVAAKPRKKKAKKKACAKRSRREKRQSTQGSTDSLEAIICGLKKGAAERKRYRGALEKIQTILKDVLG